MGHLKNRLILIAMMLALPLAGLVFFGLLTEHNFNTLPYFTEEGEMQGRTLAAQRVGAFEFTNQNGERFSSKSLKGKVWIAAFFGTDAPHVAQVTKQLLWPNFRYREEEDIILVSFSMDTQHDTPEVLSEYIEGTTMYQRLDDKWHFLTGDQSKIHDILKVDFRQEDIENTSAVFLIDTEGCVRGRYNGNREDEIKDAIEDIALLKKEMDIAAYEERKRAEENGEE